MDLRESLTVPNRFQDTDGITQGSSDGCPRTITSGGSLSDQEAGRHSSAATSIQEHSTGKRSVIQEEDQESGFENLTTPIEPAVSLSPTSIHPSHEPATVSSEDDLEPSTSAEVKERARLDAILDALRRVEKLRTQVNDKRARAKENAMLMRNLQTHLLPLIRRFVTQIKERLPHIKMEDSGTWEEDFVEIEDSLSRIEAAGQKFDAQQRSILDLDYESTILERVIYNDHVSVNPENTYDPKLLNDFDDVTAADDFLPLDMDRLLSNDEEADFAGSAASSLDLQAQSGLGGDVFYDTDEELEDTAEFISEAFVEDGLREKLLNDTLLTPRTTKERLTAYAKEERPEATSGEGDQFVFVDVEEPMFDANNAKLLENGTKQFSRSHFQNLTRWLLYGRPVSDHFVSNDHTSKHAESLQAVPSLAFLRESMLHLLEAILMRKVGSAASINIVETEAGRNASQLRSFVESWMWDPWTATGYKASSEENGLFEELNPRKLSLVRDIGARDARCPKSPIASQTLDAATSAGDSAAPNRPRSRSLKRASPEEQLDIAEGQYALNGTNPSAKPRHDFVADQQIHTRSTSFP
ncbi:hypothetical protein LTS08_008706 [Lithohypha guttulata]|nr:hypothetical protein LTS08_008706 [Lithohypha guttulata]